MSFCKKAFPYAVAFLFVILINVSSFAGVSVSNPTNGRQLEPLYTTSRRLQAVALKVFPQSVFTRLTMPWPMFRMELSSTQL